MEYSVNCAMSGMLLMARPGNNAPPALHFFDLGNPNVEGEVKRGCVAVMSWQRLVAFLGQN